VWFPLELGQVRDAHFVDGTVKPSTL